MRRSTLAIFLLFAPLLAIATSCSSDKPNEDSGDPPGPRPPLDPACESDDECLLEKPICDEFRGCVECVIDEHCAEGSRCTDARCVVPVPCASGSDCSGDEPVCNFVLGECTQCVSNGDCGESARCDQGRCIEVTPCVNTRDCPELLVCDRNLGYCVQCAADGDCPEEYTCVERACIPLCDSDRDCIATNRLCDRGVGYCVDCVQHEDCPELYHCTSGRCVVDTCLAGDTSCIEGQNALDTCNAIGSGVDTTTCNPGTTCSDDGSVASCMTWICTPGSATCDSAGESLVVCDANGLGTSQGTDCTAAGGVCENNACAEVRCEGGTRFCDANIVYQCNTSGTSFSSVESCLTTHYCEPDSATCQLKACTPGTALCDEDRLTTCDALGSGPEPRGGTDCTDTDQVCYQAACRDPICEDGTTYCKNNGIYTCENRGATERLIQACSFNQYCSDDDTMCHFTTCTPGTPACTGEVTGVCNAQGSGIDTSMGTDCSTLSNQACWNGACAPRICTNGMRFCMGRASYSCTNNGTTSTIYANCGTSSYCDPADAECKANVCTPSQPACDGNRATTCNAEGTGFLTGGTTCDTDETCVMSTCLARICTANAYYCNGGNVYRCGPDGTTTMLLDTCLANEWCSNGVSTCQLDTCTANMPTCADDNLATCAADGSGPVDSGTPCATGSVCDVNVCRPVICTPDVTDCVNADVQRCNSRGTAWSITTDCPTTSYCDEVSGPQCLEDICSPGLAACDGETLAVCGTDGGSYVTQTTNCASTNQVCNLSACADAAVETTGTLTAGSSYTNYMMGNRYYVTSARRLTNIEQYLAFTGTIQLTWFVYENTSVLGGGSFTKIYEKLTTSMGTDFHASGAIDVPLLPRRHYIIGVRPAATVTRYGQSTSVKQFLSFGFTNGYQQLVVSGALPTTVTLTSTGTSRMYQRLTTTRAN
jgi:hypothetical protein